MVNTIDSAVVPVKYENALSQDPSETVAVEYELRKQFASEYR